MNISQASQASGLPSKTIRFYEQLNLVVPIRQASNGYRCYSLEDVDKLRFLQRARAAGFGVEECRELLVLYTDRTQRDAKTHQLLGDYLQRLDQQFIALNAMRSSLDTMIAECGLQGSVNGELEVEAEVLNMAFRLVDS